jgi:hypothetical protein
MQECSIMIVFHEVMGLLLCIVDVRFEMRSGA